MLDFDLERMLFKIPKDKHNKIDIANILKHIRRYNLFHM